MSQRTLRISRRKLLQLGSIAPFAALMARGATAAEMAVLDMKLPNDAASQLLLKAQVKHPAIDPDLFKAVAKMLWQFLEAGAEARGLKVPDPEETKTALALWGYDQPNRHGQACGDLISTSISNWKPDSVPEWAPIQSATLGCAYLCGFYAAEAAIFAKTDIDQTRYMQGFKRTEQQMTQMLARATSMGKGEGDSDDRARFLAAGC